MSDRFRRLSDDDLDRDRPQQGGPDRPGRRDQASTETREPPRWHSADRDRDAGGLGGVLNRYAPGLGSRPGSSRGADNTGLLALGVGIASLAALLLTAGGLFFVALPLGVAAVVLGVRGKRRADRAASGGHRGAAKAGLALGAVSIVVSVFAFVLLTLGVLAAGEGLQGLLRQADRQEQQQQGQSLEQREQLERRAQQQREELARRAQQQREELRRRAQQQRDQRSGG